ncbi:SRPBCC family protein [Flavobacterium humi]|uniref:Polyketide cyclase n=1 Tax=Flavobacterium humi TaxID=2562683 RepID=A0A4Z0L9U4_9FLAO|nr:SRPBCC family protein [Flavobacterium humi]TGD58830.1 polyketide cyclase [Flavobacterium humi]
MKIVKKIVLALVVLIVLAAIAGLFMKKDFAIEREIVINQPKDSVFKFLKFVKNQDQFSVWNKLDPNMKKTYTGTDGTVGFIYAWESQNKNVGSGEQEIKKITEGEKIDLELRFKVPMESKNNAYLVTEAVSPTQTKVKWGFAGEMPYPWNVMAPFMGMDEMIGKDLQGGLDNLKVILEK